ncbi:bifunctional 5,10-methylenetetrahydrofolate dehydrogenase/5,10-methenyltetrahydrofolate cyclohydrolase [Mycoplasma sp. P36-A1]|uniref:bifunctional 5,10-methylenetetrahydrofolate dehydrogenase/5,10-methenyltetrahydrofolate cyclohydrolase n=1 Tax=Mycoplasma sp. P36-A1 TaxID=3252900 RepID=UPI003C2DD3A7
MNEKIIKGKDVSLRVLEDIKILQKQADGLLPKVALIRVGNNGDDMAYERSIIKKFMQFDIETKSLVLEDNVSLADMLCIINEMNKDEAINGIIIFRPLPKHLDADIIAQTISPEKDIDGMSYVNMARLMQQEKKGFLPCTPQSIMSIIDYIGLELKGLNVTVVGAGMAVGRPLSIMMLNERATVTICRAHTKDLVKECYSADVIIAAAGVKHLITKNHVKDGAVVIDVGINVEDGKLYGDVDFDNVVDKAKFITPVPGGVGSLTTLILAKHVYDALLQQNNLI